MSLRSQFKSFLSFLGACGAGVRQVNRFTNVLSAFNRIDDAHLSWFLSELSDMEGLTDRNRDRLRDMAQAIDYAEYFSEDPTQYATQKRIYRTVRSRSNFNFVKRQFMVALKVKNKRDREEAEYTG